MIEAKTSVYQVVDDTDTKLPPEAREAKQRLQKGLRSSRAVVLEYRARLLALRRSTELSRRERPLFRWDRKH